MGTLSSESKQDRRESRDHDAVLLQNPHPSVCTFNATLSNIFWHRQDVHSFLILYKAREIPTIIYNLQLDIQENNVCWLLVAE